MKPLQKSRDNLNTSITARISVMALGLRLAVITLPQSNLSDGELS